MKRTGILFLAVLASSATADNTRGFYVGFNGGLMEFHDGSAFDRDTSDARFRVVELTGGYKFNNALGGEVRVGTGLGERNETIAQTEHELKVDQYQSIYYRPELVNDEASLYGLIGYSQVERSDTTGAGEVSDSESGFSYGVGVGFVVNPAWNFNIEYRRVLDKDDYEINAATLGFDYRF